MFTGLPSEMRQTAPSFAAFPNPDSEIRNQVCGMGGGDGTSSVTPWGRTFNVLGGGESWRKGTGKGGRKGSKEGIEGKAHGLAH